MRKRTKITGQRKLGPKKPTPAERQVIKDYLAAEEERLRAKISELKPLIGQDCTSFLKNQVKYFEHAAAYLKFIRKRFDSSRRDQKTMPLAE